MSISRKSGWTASSVASAGAALIWLAAVATAQQGELSINALPQPSRLPVVRARSLLARAIREPEPAREAALRQRGFELLLQALGAGHPLALREQAAYPRARERCRQDGACAAYGEPPNPVVLGYERLLELRASGQLERAVIEGVRLRDRALAERRPPAYAAAIDEWLGRLLLFDMDAAARARPFLEHARSTLEPAAAAPVRVAIADLGSELDVPVAERLASVLRALAFMRLALGAAPASLGGTIESAGALLAKGSAPGPSSASRSAQREQGTLEHALGRCDRALELHAADVAATAADGGADHVRALLAYADVQAACLRLQRCEEPSFPPLASYRRASEVHEALLARNGGESFATAAAGLADLRSSSLIALALACPASTELRELALRAELTRKGALLGLSRSAARHAAAADRTLRARLRESYGQIARLGLPAIEHDAPPDALLFEQLRRAAALEQERNRLAPAQSIATAGMVERLRAALSEGQALLEYARYRPRSFAPDAHGRDYAAARYVVFVLQRSGPVQLLDLGEAAPIDGAARTLLAGFLRLARSSAARGLLLRPAGPPARPPERKLYDRVLAPALAVLSGERQLHVTTDAALTTVPFAALRDPRGLAIDAGLRFTHHVSSRELLARPPEPARSQALLVLAAPSYGLPGAGLLHRFEALDHSEAEAQALQHAWGERATVWLGDRASKRAFASAPAPAALHLSSHAFFLPGPPPPAPEHGTFIAADAPPALPSMLRSGIALQGANVEGGEGLLTALEVSALDLEGTQLVVLSACDTARGELRGGEGAQGLHRAFLAAGAETVVSALWPIDDAATAHLMDLYYRRLARGEPRIAALHASVAELRSDPATQHPFFWAPFVAYGLEAPLRAD